MEKYELETVEKFSSKLTEIVDYAFSYGHNSLPTAQKKKAGEQWSKPEMDFFMNKCREGFKIAQKLLIQEVLFYQKLAKENKEKLKQSRTKHNKTKTNEFLDIEKVITRRLHNLSHVADGLAIQMMAQQMHIARRLHIGEGLTKNLEHCNLEHAIKEADKINEDPENFALISDLTSFVQIGDLLIADKKQGLCISELKEGEKNHKIREFIDLTLEKGFPCAGFQPDFNDKEFEQMKRMLRQDLRVQQATEVINTDRGVDAGSGVPIVVNTPTIDLVYFDSIYPEMLEDLKTKDWSYRLLDDCLHIGFYQGEVGRQMASFVIPSLLKKHTENYMVIDLMQITEHLSETLFSKPLPKDTVVKIMTGQLKVMIGINLDELVNTFNKNGLKSRWLSTKETARYKDKGKKMAIITSKNRAIGILLPTGTEGVVSGGIISKIAFDNILPSNLAFSMATARPPEKPKK